MRARTADTSGERLFCLCQASRIDPQNPTARQALYAALRLELKRDPFLAYIDETDLVYFVRSAEYLSLAVPKDRSIPATYPPEYPQTLAKAYHWLGWSIAGLMLAGVGTLVAAPLAICLALSALNRPLPKHDQIRAVLIVAMSILLSTIAFFLVVLLIAHFPR
jgi:hypothetical protein